MPKIILYLCSDKLFRTHFFRIHFRICVPVGDVRHGKHRPCRCKLFEKISDCHTTAVDRADWMVQPICEGKLIPSSLKGRALNQLPRASSNISFNKIFTRMKIGLIFFVFMVKIFLDLFQQNYINIFQFVKFFLTKYFVCHRFEAWERLYGYQRVFGNSVKYAIIRALVRIFRGHLNRSCN